MSMNYQLGTVLCGPQRCICYFIFYIFTTKTLCLNYDLRIVISECIVDIPLLLISSWCAHGDQSRNMKRILQLHFVHNYE